jgi:tetratricopeptide (TPR) repeat protein
MIACKHCNTPNSLDSTFCKRCGTGLPESDVEAGKAKLETLVQEGMHLLNDGRISEAMAVAEAAVVADPSMISALALKSAVHERKGEISDALECAERIVELNPDSELDKIKRNQLRTTLGSQALAVAPPNKAVALFAAVMVTVILVCIVILGAKLIDRPQAEAKILPGSSPTATNGVGTPTLTPSGQPPISTGPIASNQPTAQQNPAGVPGTNQANPAPVTGTAKTAPDADDSSSDASTSPSNDSGKRTRGLPSTDGSNLDVSPLTPPAIGSQTGTLPASNGASSGSGNVTSNQKPKSADVDPPVKPDASTKPSNPVQPTPVDPGQISITVHRDRAGTVRNSPSSSSSSSSQSQDESRDAGQMYAKMGRDSYLMGKFGEAAQQFERARSSGADPIVVNERLGHSYSQLGKRQEAAEAYKRAIEACSSALNSGRGDSAKVRAVRDACETALQNIQGS